MRQALERVEEATTPTQVLSCAIERLRILMHSMARGMLEGHKLVAGSNKSSYYDHRLTWCAVGSLPARGAGLALRPHRDGKCRSTEIIMCAIGHLLVHESGKCRSTEMISCAVGLLLVHKSRKSRSTGRFRAFRQFTKRFGPQSRFGKRRNGQKHVFVGF